MNGADFAALIQALNAAMAAAKAELNALDSALGDGDHGEALAAAFAEADEKARALDKPTPTSVLQVTAQALLNRMGGASGALYGTLFLRMSSAFKDRDDVTCSDWSAALDAGLAGVQARGKASPGDKTMVDALAPAVDAFKAGADLAAGFAAARAAAAAGAAQTERMVAKFGRAKFAGERAIGHVDAGARSMALVFETLDEYWKGREHGET
ncbi:MAG: dihydroxyacetone kinase subunit L [Anaerolineae bacterium]|nr:dihydroxyacetone kinase subunit L [Anaerolineae bacterium]